MKNFPPTTLLALALISAGAFFAGRISSSDSSGGGGTASESDSKPARTSSRLAGGADSNSTKSRSARPERTDTESSRDRLKRLESIVRSENALDRNRALLAFIDQLAPEDFQGAIEHFRNLGMGDNRNGDFALLLSAWAKLDPLTAVTYARENIRGGFATNTILTTWATNDPEAAIQWANSAHQGEGGNDFYAGIIRGLAGSDPVRATELLTSMPRGEERGDALEEMVPHILRIGTESAQMWVANIKDESLRNSLMSEMAEPMAETDPQSTAMWLLANPGEAANRRSDDVFETWAERNTNEAMTAFATLPAGEFRTNALNGILDEIAGDDAKAAVAMLDRYPNDVTDQVVQTVVWESLRNDPATAVDQIARISNEGQRDQMYRRALDRWMDRDAASAQTWLQSNAVPDSVLNHLARRRGNNP